MYGRTNQENSHGLQLVERCREVLTHHPGIRLAWLFGSASQGRMTPESDVDLGVLVSPDFTDAARSALWLDLSEALGREVDLLVLSAETNPALAADVVSGLPVIGDEHHVLELVLSKTREAQEWERFIVSFYRERQESRRQQAMEGKTPSLSPSQKDGLIRRMAFCRQEIRDLEDYRALTFQRYQTDRSARRNVERIAETVTNAVIDIAKTLVAASDGPVPQSYAAALRTLGRIGIVPQDLADRLAELAALRNALAHEYLDLKWSLVRKFIESDHQDVLELIGLVERLVMPSESAP